MTVHDWHFDSSMEGWQVNAGIASVSWDGSFYKSSPGSLYCSTHNYHAIYDESLANLTVHTGDTFSVWIYPQSTTSFYDDSRRQAYVEINYKDDRWNTDSDAAYYDASGLPLNTWTKLTVSVTAPYNNRKIYRLWIAYLGRFGDTSTTTKGYLDDANYTPNGPADPVYYIYKSADSGLSFADITPSGKGAIGHRGLLASVQADNNVVTLAGISLSSLNLVTSSDSGTTWSTKQTALASPVDIAGWDKLFWADSTAPMYNSNNGQGGYNKDCTGNWDQAVGASFSNPVRIAVVW